MAVLTRYTPKDHANIDVMDRRRRGLRKLARINKSYYGNAPTFWKCKRLDDIWYTDGVINEYKCIEEPCICPKKSVSGSIDFCFVYNIYSIWMRNHHRHLCLNPNRKLTEYMLKVHHPDEVMLEA